jgi:hypothetical protein
MKLSEAINVLKAYTMDCWWPCKALGRNETSWPDIFSEAKLQLRGIMERQGIEPHTSFFVLDPENPETELYNRIATAIVQVRSAINASSV